MASLILRSCGLCALLVAILIGLFTSGFVSKYTKFFAWLDDLDVGRGKVMKGVMPVFHQGQPWGYTYEELNSTDLTGQVILVTGGNIGLGYWTAYHLASRNAEVVIACRDAKKCEDAAKDIQKATGKAVVPMVCNLGSFASILKFSEEFKLRYNHLESLILNAGVGGVSDFAQTEDGIEMIIGINHFGHFLLTSNLIPLLEKGAERFGTATVVSVSSASHYTSYSEGILPSIEAMNDKGRYVDYLAYGQSKLANVLFAQELAARLKAKNILVNSIHPGMVTTQMASQVLQRVGSKLSLYENLMKKVQTIFEDISWKASDASLTQIYAAVGKSLRNNKITGKYFHPIAREIAVDPHAQNITLQKHLWDLTEKFISSRLNSLDS